jgi:multiple sugar transport system substrate-binding protein
VTIVYWSHENEPRNELDRELIAEFTAGNPDVTVTYEVFPFEDYETKVVTALAGGTGPQLFNLFTSKMGELVESGAVSAIDAAAMGLADETAFRDLYIDGALDGFTFDAKVYAVPTELSNMALFVNRAVLAEAGLDPDADAPATWEEVRDVSLRLIQRDGDQLVQRGFEFTYGGDIDIPVLTFESMAFQLGGGVVDADTNEVIIDQAPAVEALQYWSDWVNTDRLGDPALGETTEAFCEGTVAMTTVALWFASWLEENCPDLSDVTALPFPRFAAGARDVGSFVFAYGHLVNAAASPAEQEAAWKLAAALASRPGDYLRRAGLLQPRRDLEASGALTEVRFGEVFFGDLQDSPVDQLSFEAWEAVLRAIERSTQGGVPPADSLQEAKTELDTIVAR